VFSGTAGTVTLTDAVTSSSLTFNSGDTIQDGTLTLVNSSAVHVAGGVTASIDSVLAGSSHLSVDGGGTLTLAGSNTFSGGTTLSAGTLLLGNSAALGTGSITLNDANTGSNNTSLLATIAASDDSPFANDITVADFGSGTSTIGTTDLGGF